MRKNLAVPGILALISLGLTVSALQGCQEEAAAPMRATIVYTGGVQGALEPCGCSPGQLGGIARIATLVKEIQKESSPVILVDAGDLLFQYLEVEGTFSGQLLMKAEFVQKAYGALQTAVLNLGVHDLVGGPALAIEGARKIAAAPVSANLFSREPSRALTGSARIIEAGGVRIAFVGVMDPKTLQELSGSDLEAEEPLRRAVEAVSEVRSKSDLVVLLSTLGHQANKDLAGKLEGVDLLIGAGSEGEPMNVIIPDKVGESYLVQVKPLGEFVGRIDIALNGGGVRKLVDVTANDAIQGLPPERVIPSGGIDFGDKLDLKGGPSRPAPPPVAPLPPLEPGTMRHTVYAIGDRLAQDAGIQRLLNEYKLAVSEFNRNVPVGTARLPSDGPHYVGVEACRPCHQQIDKFVKTISHAHAYATLENNQSEFDLECVGCHVTGWDRPGGFDHPAAAGNLKNVQCESCHGPGSAHVEEANAGRVGGIEAAVPMTVCLGCHTPEQSTRFKGNEESYMARIQCSQAFRAGVPEVPEGSPSAPPEVSTP